MLFDGRIISGITVFVAVAEAGSYSRAAEHIGLSRSGVGKAIARLEQRTGKRLFDRTTRALKLTDEGRAFLDEVAPLLEQLGKVALPADPAELRGHLRVSADAAFGTFLLVPALRQFVDRHPKLKIDLLIRDRVDNLMAEGVDVAIRFGEPDARGLAKTKVLESRVITCASRDYVVRHGWPRSPDDVLHGHTCVRLLDDVSGKPHDWQFRNAAGDTRVIRPDCNVATNEASTLLSAALCGFGIVRVLDFMIERELHSGALVELLPEWNHLGWPAYIYTMERAHFSHSVAAFHAFVTAYGFGRQE